MMVLGSTDVDESCGLTMIEILSNTFPEYLQDNKLDEKD